MFVNFFIGSGTAHKMRWLNFYGIAIRFSIYIPISDLKGIINRKMGINHITNSVFYKERSSRRQIVYFIANNRHVRNFL